MNENGTDRLGSWKEIAFFIGREVRTAMRWAKKQQMPVHHAPGAKYGRIFAYRSEIAGWLERTSDNHSSQHFDKSPNFSSHDSNLPNRDAVSRKYKESSPAATRLHRLRKRWLLWAIVGVFATFTAGGLLSLYRVPATLPSQVRFTENSVQALDYQGRQLWEHSFPTLLRLGSVGRFSTLPDLVRIVDLFGDGNREVLVTAPLRTGPTDQDVPVTELDCFSSRGKLLWSYVPGQTFHFGSHAIGGPWYVSDIFVSSRGARPVIWAVIVHHEWGISYVVELNSRTGNDTVRFVNTGDLYQVKDLQTIRGSFLLVGGFNNEYETGILAVIDKRRPFAASPQTAGTRHKCLSCPDGDPDFYFVFPRSELVDYGGIYENPVRQIMLNSAGFDIIKAEWEGKSDESMHFLFGLEPTFRPLSYRFDTSYDMRHRQLSRAKKLNPTLEQCPERLHPQPVRMWTPAGGWTEINLPPPG